MTHRWRMALSRCNEDVIYSIFNNGLTYQDPYNNYDDFRMIGHGAFGNVYSAVEKKKFSQLLFQKKKFLAKQKIENKKRYKIEQKRALITQKALLLKRQQSIQNEMNNKNNNKNNFFDRMSLHSNQSNNNTISSNPSQLSLSNHKPSHGSVTGQQPQQQPQLPINAQNNSFQHFNPNRNPKINNSGFNNHNNSKLNQNNPNNQNHQNKSFSTNQFNQAKQSQSGTLPTVSFVGNGKMYQTLPQNYQNKINANPPNQQNDNVNNNPQNFIQNTNAPSNSIRKLSPNGSIPPRNVGGGNEGIDDSDDDSDDDDDAGLLYNPFSPQPPTTQTTRPQQKQQPQQQHQLVPINTTGNRGDGKEGEKMVKKNTDKTKKEQEGNKEKEGNQKKEEDTGGFFSWFGWFSKDDENSQDNGENVKTNTHKKEPNKDEQKLHPIQSSIASVSNIHSSPPHPSTHQSHTQLGGAAKKITPNNPQTNDENMDNKISNNSNQNSSHNIGQLAPIKSNNNITNPDSSGSSTRLSQNLVQIVKNNQDFDPKRSENAPLIDSNTDMVNIDDNNRNNSNNHNNHNNNNGYDDDIDDEDDDIDDDEDDNDDDDDDYDDVDGTPRQVAIKQMAITNQQGLTAGIRETQTMKLCSRHPNIIHLYECYSYENSLWLVMKFCDGGTLGELCNQHHLSESLIAYIMKEILKGLAWLHSKNRVHRDLKPANILLSHSGDVQIADLGLCLEFEQHSITTSLAGTENYISPEMISGEGYSTAADLWSLGCCLVEICNRRPPMKHLTTMSVLYRTAMCEEPHLYEFNSKGQRVDPFKTFRKKYSERVYNDGVPYVNSPGEYDWGSDDDDNDYYECPCGWKRDYQNDIDILRGNWYDSNNASQQGIYRVDNHPKQLTHRRDNNNNDNNNNNNNNHNNHNNSVELEEFDPAIGTFSAIPEQWLNLVDNILEYGTYQEETVTMAVPSVFGNMNYFDKKRYKMGNDINNYYRSTSPFKNDPILNMLYKNSSIDVQTHTDNVIPDINEPNTDYIDDNFIQNGINQDHNYNNHHSKNKHNESDNDQPDRPNRRGWDSSVPINITNYDIAPHITPRNYSIELHLKTHDITPNGKKPRQYTIPEFHQHGIPYFELKSALYQEFLQDIVLVQLQYYPYQKIPAKYTNNSHCSKPLSPQIRPKCQNPNCWFEREKKFHKQLYNYSLDHYTKVSIPPSVIAKRQTPAGTNRHQPPFSPYYPSCWSPLLRDFLNQCFIKDPILRPTAEELLLHPFVNPDYQLNKDRKSDQSCHCEQSEQGLNHNCIHCRDNNHNDNNDNSYDELDEYINAHHIATAQDLQTLFYDSYLNDALDSAGL